MFTFVVLSFKVCAPLKRTDNVVKICPVAFPVPSAVEGQPGRRAEGTVLY